MMIPYMGLLVFYKDIERGNNNNSFCLSCTWEAEDKICGQWTMCHFLVMEVIGRSTTLAKMLQQPPRWWPREEAPLRTKVAVYNRPCNTDLKKAKLCNKETRIIEVRKQCEAAEAHLKSCRLMHFLLGSEWRLQPRGH